ncbi:ABC transporter permease [Ruminiclostridium cellobioparum]|jgi:osmoprotectant transport system permease protein|uniref:Proline/glycine betaine transporter permease n=1 Tax=Ruminiclostridium cellobioparum subsp. termitidis CT1112 TaxID=1195236 RepID=S0FH69_RUMCE|nr:ABC transporter permease [Ruminiclostridium cellobioparum]EMS69171.1 proline/glycine betaine transporter permease [Ruminiclostridium cellobioparum subsp. termitidis CT1112]
MFSDLIQYYLENTSKYWSYVATHITISLVVTVFAILIGIPLGIVCAKLPKLSGIITGTVNALRIIPSLALMVLMVPLIGIGRFPATIVLIIITLPPILINTITGFLSVKDSIRETAIGMGMSAKQVFLEVEFPLALPLIAAGIRTAVVEVVATTAIASYIGAGGLGVLVSSGIGYGRVFITLLGGGSIAVISIAADLLLEGVQNILTKRMGLVE